MRAMVLREFGKPVQLADVPVPKPGAREVLIAVKACGTGLTLTWVRQGRTPGMTLPRIIGHEVGGVVAAVGSAVTECKAGDRVTVQFYLLCRRCRFCRTGRETLCTDFGGVIGVAIDGGYAEYMKVPVENVIAIPDGVGFAEAGVASDAIATPVHVARDRARIKPLDEVLVVGAGGGVGIHMVQVAKVFGARVIAVDVSDEKVAAAEALGADEALNVKGKNLAAEVQRVTGGRGVDVAIDFVATKETLEASVRALATAGTLVLVGGNSPPTIEIEPRQLSMRELVLTGNRYATREDIVQALELVRQGRVKAVINQTFPLEQADEVHQRIDRSEFTGRAALIVAP